MKKVFLLFVALGIIFSNCSKNEELTTRQVDSQKKATATLALVAEKTIYKLLPGYDSDDTFEPSGITRNGDYLYVVFDERQAIGKFHKALYTNSSINELIGSGKDSEHEAITLDSYGTQNYYVAVESVKKSGKYYPQVKEYGANLDLQYTNRIDYRLPSANKGFEGLAWLRRNSSDYLLGLVEGTGTVVVMEQGGHDWDVVATISAPVNFADYSDIAIDTATLKVAITSQEDKKLWVGSLSSSSWSFGSGTVYNFPSTYYNVEGVTWMDSNTIASCTDKGDGNEQAIQIFDL